MPGGRHFDDFGLGNMFRYLANEVGCELLIVFAYDHQRRYSVSLHFVETYFCWIAATKVLWQVDVK